MNNQIVNVCVAFSDTDGKYIFGAAITILSVVLQSEKNIKIHVLSDETLTQRGKNLLESIAHSQCIEIQFYTINRKLFDKIMIPNQYKFSIGSFYRLLIPEIIKSEVAVYFDCDVLCLTDVNELGRNICEDKSYLAAVVQDSYVESSQYLKEILREKGIDHRKYFNSGVLVFNCENINRLFSSFSKSLIRICHDNRHSHFIDQDALNIAFKNIKIKWMDVRYNYMMNIPTRFVQTEKQLEGKILHFANIKPWMAPELPPSIIYAKYYSQVMQIYQSITD